VLIIAAASPNHGKMVKLLLDRGADVHARDKKELTALIWAENKGHKDTADLLRAHMSRL
jgi:ankyrin repeat protein